MSTESPLFYFNTKIQNLHNFKYIIDALVLREDKRYNWDNIFGTRKGSKVAHELIIVLCCIFL